MPTIAEQYAAQVTYATAALELPDGKITVHVRRPPVQAWIQTACLPPYFDADVREAWRKAGGMPKATPSGFGVTEANRIATEIIRWAVVSPRIVDTWPLEEGEIHLSQITFDDWNFLAEKISDGSIFSAVRMADGTEVEMSDLRSFRDGEEGAGARPAATPGDPQQQAAVGASGNP